MSCEFPSTSSMSREFGDQFVKIEFESHCVAVLIQVLLHSNIKFYKFKIACLHIRNQVQEVTELLISSINGIKAAIFII